MKTCFQRVLVLGYGKAAGDILKYIADRRSDYAYQLEFIEHEIHALSVTENICTERGIPFQRIPEKAVLARYLDGIAEKTLIVSASNNFLFPGPWWKRKTSPSSIFTTLFCQIIPGAMPRAG